MQRVIEQAGYLKNSVKALMGIASGLYSALAEDQNGIQSFSKELQKADKAVNSAKFQDTLKSWAVGAKVAQSAMRDSFSEIGDAGYSLRHTVGNVFGDAGRTIASFTKNVSRLLKNSSGGISDFSSGVSDGFQKVFNAVGDVSPMFSQLLSTVGQLSKTFGGTLAASLRASAPLIQAIATAAEAVAKAFSALPEPIQAALGVFATFGKAGKTALDTVKLAVVENTMKSLQWQKALMELGVTSAGTGVTLKNVAQGWVASNPAVSKFVSNVGSAEGAMGKVKAVASGLGGMLASTVSNPVIGAWLPLRQQSQRIPITMRKLRRLSVLPRILRQRWVRFLIRPPKLPARYPMSLPRFRMRSRTVSMLRLVGAGWMIGQLDSRILPKPPTSLVFRPLT